MFKTTLKQLGRQYATHIALLTVGRPYGTPFALKTSAYTTYHRGMGGPYPPSPPHHLGLIKCRTRRFTARSTHSDAAHISLSVTALCPTNIKSVAPNRQFCGSALYTKADSERKGL